MHHAITALPSHHTQTLKAHTRLLNSRSLASTSAHTWWPNAPSHSFLVSYGTPCLLLVTQQAARREAACCCSLTSSTALPQRSHSWGGFPPHAMAEQRGGGCAQRFASMFTWPSSKRAHQPARIVVHPSNLSAEEGGGHTHHQAQHHHRRYCGNQTTTTKYNLLTFIPKSLFEQYRCARVVAALARHLGATQRVLAPLHG